jgi:hypothetical protein
MSYNVVVALVMMASPPAASTRLADVQSLIAAQGARQALSVVLADDVAWDSLLEQVGTGTREWLAVAAQLRPVSDAHASETLDMAIQEALPHNAAGVLALVAAGVFSAEGACGMYGFGQIEDERPVLQVLGLVDKRIVAVTAIKAAKLAPARDACLGSLKALRASLKKQQAG